MNYFQRFALFAIYGIILGTNVSLLPLSLFQTSFPSLVVVCLWLITSWIIMEKLWTFGQILIQYPPQEGIIKYLTILNAVALLSLSAVLLWGGQEEIFNGQGKWGIDPLTQKGELIGISLYVLILMFISLLDMIIFQYYHSYIIPPSDKNIFKNYIRNAGYAVLLYLGVLLIFFGVGLDLTESIFIIILAVFLQYGSYLFAPKVFKKPFKFEMMR